MFNQKAQNSDLIHPAAIVETEQIGAQTRVAAFAYLQRGAVIGAGCEIGERVLVEHDVQLGQDVQVKSGAQLWAGLRVENHVLIGPQALFLNDRGDHSRLFRHRAAGQTGSTLIREGACVGAQATILPGVSIGKGALVETGAVVTHDVPSHAIVTGNPARIVGYVDLPHDKPAPPSSAAEFEQNHALQRQATKVRGVWLHRMKIITDLRGNLSVGEIDQELPFAPQRYFVVFGVASRQVRGEHAHRRLHQFLVCLQGDCALVVDDGQRREEIRLDSPAIGVHLEPLVWGIQYKFSSDALLLVLASGKYDPNDYIRDYDEFERLSAQDSGTTTWNDREGPSGRLD